MELFNFDIVENPAITTDGKENIKPVDNIQETPKEETPKEEEDLSIEETPEVIETSTEEASVEESTDDSELTPLQVYSQYLIENTPIEFEGDEITEEMVEKAHEKLPEIMFMQVVDSLHSDAQTLLSYALNLGQDASQEKLTKFFQDFIQPQEKQLDINTDEGAKEFLNDHYSKIRAYRSVEDLEDAIDSLADKGKLQEYAKAINEEQNAEKEKLKQKTIEETKKQRLETKEQEKQYVQSIQNALDSTGWTTSRKRAVAQNLNSQILNKKNELIRKSPKAVIQLADIYSYFNEKTGEFDFSKLIDQKAESKNNEKTKRNIDKDKFSSTIARIGTGTGKSKKPNSNKNLIKPQVIIEEDSIFSN